MWAQGTLLMCHGSAQRAVVPLWVAAEDIEGRMGGPFLIPHALSSAIFGKKIDKRPSIRGARSFSTLAASTYCERGHLGVPFKLQDMCNVYQTCILETCVSAFERTNQIKTLLSQGVSAARIAEEVGVAQSTVHRIKNKFGPRKGNRAAYKTVSAKLTDQECAVLDGLVKTGVAANRSALLRKMTRAITGFYDPSPDEDQFLRKADRDLSGLSTNFNQLTTALNTSVKRMGHASPTPAQIERVREANDDVKQIRKVIGMMLNNMQVKSASLKDRIATQLPEDADDE